MRTRGTLGRWRALAGSGWLARALFVVVLLGTRSVTAAEGCDLRAIRDRAALTMPDYTFGDARVAGGVVTLVVTRGSDARFAVALVSPDARFFTSVVGVGLSDEEFAYAKRTIESWTSIEPLRGGVAACAAGASGDGRDPEARVREGAEGALRSQLRALPRAADVYEASLPFIALVIALALALVPALRRRSAPGEVTPPWVRQDLAIVLCIAAVGVAVATAVAQGLAPEADEGASLGARHDSLWHLASFRVGGEPFNPPGPSLAFGMWLHLGSGLKWARALPITLIPLTALVAYRGGVMLADRRAGVAFAALAVLAPAYLRLAAIARGYAFVVLALVMIAAAIGRSERAPSRGTTVALAGLFAIWMSYLLWPVALAAPCIVRLARRDRVRITGALGVMAGALVPRLWSGFSTAMQKTDQFELSGPTDALGFAIATAGLGPTDGGPRAVAWLGGSLVVALVIVAFRSKPEGWAPNAARSALAVTALVAIPVAALLAGGHGIRGRHVVCLHVAIALVAALGLSAVFAGASKHARALSWMSVLLLAVTATVGVRDLILRTDGYLAEIDRWTAGAATLMIVPTSAHFAAHAMLTGDGPEARQGIAWPPVCETSVERFCTEHGTLKIVATDQVTGRVIAEVSRGGASVWLFDRKTSKSYGDIPPAIRRCPELHRDESWIVHSCAASDLVGAR